MNRKIYTFTLILLFSCASLFARDNKFSIYNRTILPTSSKIGKIESGKLYSSENYFKQMFKDEYSLNWVERYVKDEYKYSFTKENSKILAELLPVKGPIYTSKITLKPNNRTINLLIEDKTIVKIILEKQSDKIIAMEII